MACLNGSIFFDIQFGGIKVCNDNGIVNPVMALGSAAQHC